MKHAFRFIWWLAMGALMLALGIPLFALGAYVIYPLWNFRWYNAANHKYPENYTWRDMLHDWPKEILQRAIGTYAAPKEN